jgi:hypothetical protein
MGNKTDREANRVAPPPEYVAQSTYARVPETPAPSYIPALFTDLRVVSGPTGWPPSVEVELHRRRIYFMAAAGQPRMLLDLRYEEISKWASSTATGILILYYSHDKAPPERKLELRSTMVGHILATLNNVIEQLMRERREARAARAADAADTEERVAAELDTPPTGSPVGSPPDSPSEVQVDAGEVERFFAGQIDRPAQTAV